MCEKYNTHLSSLKLRLDEGQVILVIIREERRKEDEEGNEDSHLVMQSCTEKCISLLDSVLKKRMCHGNSYFLYIKSAFCFKGDKRRTSLYPLNFASIRLYTPISLHINILASKLEAGKTGPTIGIWRMGMDRCIAEDPR